jgi:hypothetical protein
MRGYMHIQTAEADLKGNLYVKGGLVSPVYASVLRTIIICSLR